MAESGYRTEVRPPCPHGNIFARELDALLKQKKWERGIGQLDNRPTDIAFTLGSSPNFQAHSCVHSQKVSRLRESLCSSETFPVLNPEEIERSRGVFGLTSDDLAHLYAAILAATFQRTLVRRMRNPEAAYAITEKILGVLDEAFQADFRNNGPLRESFRGSGSLLDAPEEVSEDEEVEGISNAQLAAALELADRADVAMQFAGFDSLMLRSTGPTISQRIASMHEAIGLYTAALEALDALDEDARASEAWRSWRKEIEDDRAAAQESLNELGV